MNSYFPGGHSNIWHDESPDCSHYSGSEESNFSYHDECSSPVPSFHSDARFSRSSAVSPHLPDASSPLSPSQHSDSSFSVSSLHFSSPNVDTDGDDDSFNFSSPNSPDGTADHHGNTADLMFDPLYSGSSVTLCGAVSAIMNFCTSAKLPYNAIERLLKLLDLLCPSPNLLPKSVFLLKKFFKRYKFEFSLSEYCSECFELIDQCSCTCNAKTRCHIVDVPIKKTLEVIVSSKFVSCCLLSYLYCILKLSLNNTSKARSVYITIGPYSFVYMYQSNFVTHEVSTIRTK